MIVSDRIIALLLFLLLFVNIWLPCDAWRRRRRRRPPPCPYVCSASNPAPNTNPQGLTSGATGVCRVTEYRSEQYCTPCGCGSCPAYRSQAIQVLRCCTGYRQSGSSCPIKIPCGSPRDVPNGERSPSKASFAVGEKVTYTCNTHYQPNRGTQLTCQVGPRWSANAPDCVPKPCSDPPIPAHAAISGGARGSYNVGTSITMVCASGYRLVSGSATRTCSLGNRWTGIDVVCKPVCAGHVDTCKNGGTCTSPEFCSNCSEGFYSPRCDPCPRIENCAKSICRHPDPEGSKTCKTCAYDFGNEGGRAYQPSTDGKTCLKRCSWRADSKYCYPGQCGLVETCRCGVGFSSPDTNCNRIVEHPRINPGFIRFYYGGELEGQPRRINVTESMMGGGRLYTNARIINVIHVSISANYIKVLPQAPPYVVRNSIGLSNFSLDFKLFHSSGTVNILSVSPSMRESTGVLRQVHQVDQSVNITQKCRGRACELASNDRFRFTTFTQNGGFITIRNPETNTDSNRDLTGVSSQRVIEINVDRDAPQHCSKTNAGCGEPLTLEPSGATTSRAPVAVRWTGWSDAISGLGITHLTVSEMQLGDDGLLDVAHGGEHMYHWSSEIPQGTFSANVNLPTDKSSVYEVKAVICDRVIEKFKNCKATRRFMLRDVGTQVSNTSTPIRVVNQVVNGEALWITKPRSDLTVGWRDHFQNEVYSNKGLLNAIRGWPINGEDPFYDHSRGVRNISQVQNIRGISQFQTQVNIRRLGTSNFVPSHWLDVGRTVSKTYSYSDVGYVDGESCRFFINASDIVGHSKVDFQTVHFDSTPPEIENITLVKDGRDGINVHSSKELFKAKFQFKARDIHSGLHTVEWTLYDNFTRTELVHGTSHLDRQRYPTLAACQLVHPASSCYSTGMSGVFAEVFEVQLNNGNMKPGMDLTQHDYDLQFKVTVKNNALLSSELTFQISIDTTGPSPGHVLDGIAGSPEVDFQNSLGIKGHWKDFYDKESSIAFYKFKFGTRCFTIGNFNLSVKTDETVNDFAQWTAPGPGKYYLTVVAYNNALEPSVPVCSNGVMIDATPPTISSVTVDNVRTRPGLVKDAERRLWLVDNHTRRRPITNVTATCLDSASLLPASQIAILPLLTIPHRPLPAKSLTNQECRQIGRFNQTTVLSVDSHLNVTFSATDGGSGVEDTSVALVLASEDGNPVVGTEEWTSSHGASFVNLRHPDLRHGARLFIKIKARNRAQLQVIETIGPLVVNVRAPAVSGNLHVERKGSAVWLSWQRSSILDSVTPFPLQYSISAGRSAAASDFIKLRSIASYPKCPGKDDCFVVEINGITSGRRIYFHLHTVNVAGHKAVLNSLPFQWKVFSGSSGILRIVDLVAAVVHPQLSREISCQSNSESIKLVWFGFHLSENVTSTAIVIIDKSTGVSLKQQAVDFKANGATMNHLTLREDQSYSVRITVTTAYGSVFAQSMPVRIMRANRVFTDLNVVVGDPCPHLETCERNMMQASTSHLHVTWTHVAALQSLHPRILLGLQLYEDAWKQVKSQTIDSSSQKNFTFNKLSLPSGRLVRATVRLCVDSVCSEVRSSLPIIISVDAPTTGAIDAVLLKGDQIQFSVAKFGLRGFRLSQHNAYMHGYEWRLQSVHDDGTRDMAWQALSSSGSDSTHISGNISLPGNISATSCVEFVVRGKTKSGITNTVKKMVGSCSNGRQNFQPHTVIDAKGPLSLGNDNFEWKLPDIDYLVDGGVVAAVWPSLRHGSFQYAVIESPWSFRGGFFVTEDTQLTKPCDHKDAVFCGNTTGRYMSSRLNLRVDKRYHVCIHANRTVRGRGSGREVLPAISACSDGVTVIPKIPKPGTVTAGPLWSSSTSLLILKWSGFFNNFVATALPHNTLVKEYLYKIGTSKGSDNVIRYTSVGLAHEKTVSGLTLFNKEKYYVTVKAINLVGVEAEAEAQPVGIDLEPPAIVRPEKFVIENSQQGYLTDISMVRLRWTGVFEDDESGICSYQWCVGSRKGLCNILRPRSTREKFVSENLDAFLQNGNSYYFGLRAFDCVGHSTLYTSPAYYVVKRGPQAGQVFDGESGEDLDYQVNTDMLSAHWTGFVDEFSDIVEYKVHVSSLPGAADVIRDVSVGLHTSVTFNHLELRYGVRYLFGVTACNRAGLCVTQESDGLLIDETPPILGRVIDGNKDEITFYQHSRSLVEFQLVGFSDLESGLSTLDWCLTRTGSECDLSSNVTVPFESVIRARLSSPLPTGTLIRVRVTVHNHVGLSTKAISPGFTIDESPPAFSSPCSFDLRQFSKRTGTQVAVTRLGLQWTVTDAQSGIWEQFVHVKAHSQGSEVTQVTRLPGFSIGSLVLTKLALRDGYRYQAKVTACNRAGRCRTSISSDLLVDNSPPQVGMFLPRTNASFVHAGDREMTWDTNQVTVSWQGFSDAHSGVSGYLVTVGTSYLADDLLKATTVTHVNTKREQKRTFRLLNSISAGATIFISLRAVNRAGLKSHPLHSAFVAHADKNLDIVRRCTSENCLGHCVCAPLHQSCAPTSTCADLTGRVGSRPTVTVRDIINFATADDAKFTTERCIIAAAWTPSNTAGIRRYEVSAGLANSDTPAGLFNTVSERVWFDVGQDSQAILNLTQRSDKCMRANVNYKFFVRAWYDSTTYAQFTSNGITPLIEPPQVLRRKGTRMWEANPSTPDRDVDIILSGMSSLLVQWPRQFNERLPASLNTFSLALGTTCGGTDVVDITTLGSNTKSHRFNGLEFFHGRKYIATILACDFSGLCSLACSDGAKADFTRPIGGLVVNSLTGLTNKRYQRNRTHVSTSWLEFTDPETSIASYDWCIGRSDSPSNCAHVNWKTMGLRTHARTVVSLSKPLDHGEEMVPRVRAHNPAGDSSSVTVSGQSLIVDTKPPYLIGACQLDPSAVVKNPTFSQFRGSSIRLNRLNATWWQRADSTVNDWSLSASSQAQIVESVFSHTETWFVLVRGGIKQALSTTVGRVYSLEIQVADINNWFDRMTKRGYVKIGDITSHSFSIQSRKASSDHITWLKKFYHFKAKSTTTILELGTLGLDMEGLGFDSITLKTCASTSSSSEETSLTVSAEQADGQVRVHASWAAHDDLSGLADVKWALGTVPGGVQLQVYTHVDAKNSLVQTPLLTVPQDTPLHFSLLLVDRAGSASLHHAQSIYTDFSAPEVEFSVTGNTCASTCVVNGGSFEMTVAAVDKQSGISRCSVALGASPRADDIVPYRTLTPESSKKDIRTQVPFATTAVNGRIVYPTIVCVNARGVSQTKTLVNGIRIVTSAPSAASAYVRIVTPSKTHYPRVNPFQSDRNTLVFTYDKFTDVSGADFFYEYSLEGPAGSPYRKTWHRLEESRIRMVILEGLNLVDGATYALSVRAVNTAQLTSQPVSTNVTIESQPPAATKGAFSVLSLTTNKIKLDWTSVFRSVSSLFYEVLIGSGVGKSDIFGLIETRKTTMTLDNVDPLKSYHVIVSAISNSGLFTRQSFVFRGGHQI